MKSLFNYIFKRIPRLDLHVYHLKFCILAIEASNNQEENEDSKLLKN